MYNKLMIGICCATVSLLLAYNVFAVSKSMPPHASTVPSANPDYSRAGYVSLERIVKFEDIQRLSPALAHAAALLRTGHCQEALAAFQAIQRNSPAEALAYRGENEASRFLNTLDSTIARDQQLLSAARTRSGPNASARLSAINYGIGDAMSMKNYPTPIGEAPRDLGPEPKRQLFEAIRLEPNLVEAHLALAAYYEHGSQRQGTAARREYDVCLRLRPDLYQIRYLHAASWDRPGLPTNEAELRAQGIKLSNDEKKMPQMAIAENLALLQDHPNYPPPYYSLGSDYADPRYPTRDDVRAKHYLAIYARVGDPTSDWWRYATAEVKTIDGEQKANHG